MKSLQRYGAWAAVANACIYIAMFVYYGAVAELSASASPQDKLLFMQDNLYTLATLNVFGYMVFGVLLAVVVQACYERIKPVGLASAHLASVFGFIWVGVIIAAGMVANISLFGVTELYLTDPQQAATVWLSTALVQQALGGGVELLGGLWVLLLSISFITSAHLSKALNILGVVVGITGILTLIPAGIFTELFGLLQIIWFGWLGVALLRAPQPTAGADGKAP
ncbi:hypothetical protein OCL06_00345 [Alteromonas sp. ASW11-19]|uniref:DUF4386 family protein n=1 Tax=Alteromonas salexigens TaxID=2982530 RepID=A0ABT2VJ26_9ALTE|nr:hypothetical protein [Alteromonas salexigens]MCU7553039.1 hypothetical protein [Alteromonas salexigens]